jgi:hypothetical protein
LIVARAQPNLDQCSAPIAIFTRARRNFARHTKATELLHALVSGVAAVIDDVFTTEAK